MISTLTTTFWFHFISNWRAETCTRNSTKLCVRTLAIWLTNVDVNIVFQKRLPFSRTFIYVTSTFNIISRAYVVVPFFFKHKCIMNEHRSKIIHPQCGFNLFRHNDNTLKCLRRHSFILTIFAVQCVTFLGKRYMAEIYTRFGKICFWKWT